MSQGNSCGNFSWKIPPQDSEPEDPSGVRERSGDCSKAALFRCPERESSDNPNEYPGKDGDKGIAQEWHCGREKAVESENPSHKSANVGSLEDSGENGGDVHDSCSAGRGRHRDKPKTCGTEDDGTCGKESRNGNITRFHGKSPPFQFPFAGYRTIQCDYSIIGAVWEGGAQLPAITVSDLHKFYGALHAVRGVSFTVEAGEVFGLLGPNGAGKTTTIETIIGLLPRDRGDVRVLGVDPAQDPFAIKSRIGVQLQTVHLFPRLTVVETLHLFSSFYRKSRSIDELLTLVGLSEKAHARVEKLSGGQLKRLSVALALVGDGEIIFLDEPTSGLDPQSRRGLWDTILWLKGKGKTVFLTTHYLDEAERLCDRVAIIDHGVIIALGSPRALIAEHFREKAIEIPLGSFEDSWLFSLPGVTRLQQDEHVVTVYTENLPQTFAALSRLAEERAVPLANVVIREATLEDVFLKLTGRRIRE